MLKARITLDRDFTVGEADPRLFGSFIEHLGRAVYTGMYEPGHPAADANGFRRDVIDLVRELNVPVVRYPGGNYVSGYRWEDGVGPREKRPTRLDLAWFCTDTNQVGTNEFVEWCRLAGTEPMLAVNLGTRGVQEAMDLIEYCNHPGGTYWSDLRRSHGHAEPHRIKYWCLGNEMDGPWQIGHKTAQEYGRLAAETAKVLKWVDPTVQLITCGSAGHAMPTFGAWEMEVLEHTYEHTDFLSVHMYHGNVLDDMSHYLPLADEMDDFIREAVALCDAVAAKKKTRRKIMLSFDEWNVWYHSTPEMGKWQRGESQVIRDPKWSCGVPLLEDRYNFADALLAGSMMLVLLNNADRVKMACLAQLINVIAPIMTEKGGPAWRQTIFYPFLHGSKFGRGTVLRQVLDVPRFDTPHRQGSPFLLSSCVWHADRDELVVFAVNRSQDRPLLLEADLRAFPALRVEEWITMTCEDLKRTNTAQAPDAVAPRTRSGASCDGARLEASLDPLSWNVIRMVKS